MNIHPDIFQEIARLRQAGEEAALAIIVNTTASTPGRVNFKMLVYPDGRILGTVGGGLGEAKVIEAARQSLKDKRNRFLHLKMTEEAMDGIGVLCGGEADVYIEPVGAPPFLYIFGGGHIGQALAYVTALLDFRLILIDDRVQFANRERFPQACEVRAKGYADALDEIRYLPSDCAVIVSRGHAADELILRETLRKDPLPAYIGMIGSRAKNAAVFDHLRKEGISPELLQRVHAPIGLGLGGETPGEIAISILAEIIAHRHGKLSKP
ncbi:MAG: XdhC/CoxI family protein [bacterium]